MWWKWISNNKDEAHNIIIWVIGILIFAAITGWKITEGYSFFAALGYSFMILFCLVPLALMTAGGIWALLNWIFNKTIKNLLSRNKQGHIQQKNLMKEVLSWVLGSAVVCYLAFCTISLFKNRDSEKSEPSEPELKVREYVYMDEYYIHADIKCSHMATPNHRKDRIRKSDLFRYASNVQKYCYHCVDDGQYESLLIEIGIEDVAYCTKMEKVFDDNRLDLYKKISRANDLDGFEQFCKTLNSAESRRHFYNVYSDAYELGEYKEFERYVGACNLYAYDGSIYTIAYSEDSEFRHTFPVARKLSTTLFDELPD